MNKQSVPQPQGTAKEIITSDELTRTVFKSFLLPSVFALLASNLSSTIDTVIIGNALNEKGLAAMSVVSPIYLIYFTIGSMIAVGSSIMANICLGKNKPSKAGGFFAMSFILAISIGIVMTIMGLVFLDDIVKLLGGEKEIVPLAKDYCFYYICGGTATLLFYIPFNFLKIMGKPKKSMILLITMSVSNVLLTLVFVYILKMSIGGAALATVISLFLAFLLSCFYMFSKKSVVKLAKPQISLKDFIGIFTSGSASAFNNLARAIIVMSLNIIILIIGTHFMLSVYTVARNVNDLFMTIVLGISQAIIPIVSLFYGERDNMHIKLAMKSAAKSGSIIIAVSAAVMVVFTRPFILLFGVSDPRLLGFDGCFAVLCVAISLNAAFINTLFSNYYSAIRKPVIPNVILALRVLFTIDFAFLFGNLFDSRYVWLCFVAAEVMTSLFSAVFVHFYTKVLSRRKGIKLNKLWLLDDFNESEGKSLHYSVRGAQNEIVAASQAVAEFCEQQELSMKKQMTISLAVEELLLLMFDKCFDNKQTAIDIRVFISMNVVMLRIRAAGKKFNPIAYYESSEDALTDSMGAGIILKMAQMVEYNDVLGINNLVILV